MHLGTYSFWAYSLYAYSRWEMDEESLSQLIWVPAAWVYTLCIHTISDNVAMDLGLSLHGYLQCGRMQLGSLQNKAAVRESFESTCLHADSIGATSLRAHNFGQLHEIALN